ncbi:MAG TPA: hypothetical protein VMB25_09165 [Bryobacteraceae bacterium]|nr:hypothetical protein [Bryobacteraceae bacterium]
MAGGASFRELQSLPRRRTAIVLALPPCGMLGILVWQVLLGHPWGKDPMSNSSVIGWTVFLWILYLRLLTVRLSTQVRDGKLAVGLRGLLLRRRVPLSDIASVETVNFDPRRDYGGYGIRSIRDGKAYVAAGNRGVRIKLRAGPVLVVGSKRPDELAAALRA